MEFEFTELLTWEMLKSPGTLIFIVFLTVAFTKNLADNWVLFRKAGTFWYGYFWAVVWLAVIAIGEGTTDFKSIALLFANALIIEVFAAVANDVTIKQHFIKVNGNHLNGMG